MRQRPLAVVLGDLDLVSALGMAGIRCMAVAPPTDPVRHSRFVVGSIDPGEGGGGEHLVDRLVRFAQTQPSRPVLFYQTDADLLLASRYRDRLHEAYRFTVPDADLVENLVDKARFRELADKLGLPVPSTEVLRPAEDPTQSAALRYPLLLKPLTRADLTSLDLPGKAVAVHSAVELLRVWEEARTVGVELLAQQLVPGPETAVESYHAYVDDHARVVAEFTGAKVRTRPTTFGYSTALRITEAADVAEAGRALVDSLRFRGVLKADLKRDERGTLHLLEVNPRFIQWHHLGAAAGVNLPALVYADLTGQAGTSVPQARAGHTWCQVGGDRRAAADQGVSLIAWLSWLLRTSARAEGRWTDPMPVLRGVLLPKLGLSGPRRSRGGSDSSEPDAAGGALE